MSEDAPRPRGKRVKPWRLEVKDMIAAEMAYHLERHHPHAGEIRVVPIALTRAEGSPHVLEDGCLPGQRRAPAPRSWFRRLLDRLEAAAL